jgi:hypothetical protein
LLVGAQYGEDRPDGKHSYTHLEYREARAQGIPVHTHFIGPGYSKRDLRPSAGSSRLHPLAKAVLAHRAAAFHDVDLYDTRTIIDKILFGVREVWMKRACGRRL